MSALARIRLDRIASSTRNAALKAEATIAGEIISRAGFVIAVRILTDKTAYNTVEELSGRMVPLRAGDLLAGTLGSRNALRGYVGTVPDQLAPGDIIQVLNLGGVLGRCTSVNPANGPPFDAEVLGAVLEFPELGDRIGRPAEIAARAIPPAQALQRIPPVIYVAGTCMDAGKTVAACELVRGLTRAGLRVATAKLTGVALLRDSLAMLDAGAIAALTFNDAGLASTRANTAVPAARGLFNRLALLRPDLIVAELGDGILGEYGVKEILGDAELMRAGAAWVLAAPDPVGCWGAREILSVRHGLALTVVTGPVTDNEAGCAYIRDQLELPAHNARRDPAGLVAAVLTALAARKAA